MFEAGSSPAGFRVEVEPGAWQARCRSGSGAVSVGDVAAHEDPRQTGKAVAGISTPGGAHSQTRPLMPPATAERRSGQGPL